MKSMLVFCKTWMTCYLFLSGQAGVSRYNREPTQGSIHKHQSHLGDIGLYAFLGRNSKKMEDVLHEYCLFLDSQK